MYQYDETPEYPHRYAGKEFRMSETVDVIDVVNALRQNNIWTRETLKIVMGLRGFAQKVTVCPVFLCK